MPALAGLRRGLTAAVLAGLVIYAAAAALLYAFQPRFIYFPGPPPTRTPADIGLPFEPVRLAPVPGAEVHGWWVPAGPEAPALLFLHGNAGNIGHRLDSIALLHESGLSVLIIDYRGFGASSGAPGEQATAEDAMAAWDWLTGEQGIAPGRIVVFGRSLGGAVAIDLASRVRPGALIIESSFTSLADMAAHFYPWLPARRLVRIRYPSLERLPAVRSPMLIVHSRADELVPFAMGEALYRSAPAPKAFLEINGGHNDGFLRSRSRWQQGIAAFIAEHIDSGN